MEIRLARSSDAHDIHSIIMDANSEYKYIPGSSSALDETTDSIHKCLESGKEKALIGLVDSSAIACVR